MGRRWTQVTVYLASGVFLFLAAYLAYPLFSGQIYRGLTDEPPTVVIFQDKPVDTSGVPVSIEIESRGDKARVVLDEKDLSHKSEPGATTYIGLEQHLGAADFRYTPLECSVDTDGGPDARIGTDSLEAVWEQARKEGDAGGPFNMTGEVTTITLDNSTATVAIECTLPDFGFQRESLANWNLYLPGVMAVGVGGAKRPIISYYVGREATDYLVLASQYPSETLARYFVWYERDFDLLARQGLFLTVSNPTLQQVGAYRLFIAGALVGLGGGFLVAAVQTFWTDTRL